MKFCVATPVFNGLPHLRPMVGSVRAQHGEVDVHHVVQDGGSTDGSADYVLEQEDLDARSEPDEGMYDAINRCWQRSEGDVYSWLNADEQYLPGTLSKVAKFFHAHPDVDAVFGNVIIVDGAWRPLAARREIPLRKCYVQNGLLYALSCATFFRGRLKERSLLGFDTRYRIAGDLDMILSMMQAGVRFGHVPSYFSLFMVDGDNLSVDRRAREEIGTVHKVHGGFSSRALQRLVLLGRYTERWLKGCYRPDTLAYDVALDDTPHYRREERADVTFRFTFDKTNAKKDAAS